VAAFGPLNPTSTVSPETQEELAALVADAYAHSTPLYPIGGGTSLDYGLPAKLPGIGVDLKQLNRVIDFPARDLTVTVEAGITMQALSEVLAKEGLRLPVDVPHPERATLGGVIATGWSGPRRYGHGTIRDFVIGIRAIDGRGEVFNGGGRVVKNVAGYDFCKLLTGSLGSIGIITQVTLKLRPVAEATVLHTISGNGLVSAITHSDITPAVVDCRHAEGREETLVLLEGTSREVEWMSAQLQSIVKVNGKTSLEQHGSALAEVWPAIRDFAAQPAPLMLKASVRNLNRFTAMVIASFPEVKLHAHAASGIVYIAFATFPKDGLSRTLVGKLQPLAAQCGGHIVVLSNPSGQEMTPQSVWGTIGPQLELMQAVKRQFDPRGILNPGRFVV
jgi:glycolate oxidase FAD binding subunit